MKNLIVYYSFTKNNEKLAYYLRSKLNCDSVKIETVKKRTGFSILLDLVFDRKPEIKPAPYYLRDYDHIIFIAPIWASKIAMPLKSYLMDQKSSIRSYSFISVCGGRPGQKEKIFNELSRVIGKQPLRVDELSINDLIHAKDETIKVTSSYKITPNDFVLFETEVSKFLDKIGASGLLLKPLNEQFL